MSYFRRNVPLHTAIRPCPARGGCRGRKGRFAAWFKLSPPQAAPKSPIEIQVRMNFPGPISSITKEVRGEEVNARAARTPAQNVRQDCANGEQNHIYFFILGVPACFPQSAEKFYIILKSDQQKRGKSLSPCLHPSMLFPHLVTLKKGEWGVDAQQPAQPELGPAVPMSPVSETAFFLLPCGSTVVALL